MDKNFFVLAHNIRSLHNVGSIFRTSDCFAIDKLFLSGYTGHPPDPRLEKVSLGADKTVPWEYQKSAIRLIKKLKSEYSKLTVVGLENNISMSSLLARRETERGRTTVKFDKLPSFHPKFPLLLILGEEVGGISKPLLALCDQFLEIPQFGTKESLNLSVAFGIAAYAIKARM